MSNHTEFVKANEKYVTAFGDKGSLPMPPGKKLTIITCMDARIDPNASLGIKEGDAHIIRNAGGRAIDPGAVRSLVISQRLLGTREIAVFHHTDCGMLTFKTQDLRDLVKKAHDGDAKVAKHVDEINFLEIADVEESIKEDVLYLQEHPLIPEGTKITGWVYDVHDGKVRALDPK